MARAKARSWFTIVTTQPNGNRVIWSRDYRSRKAAWREMCETAHHATSKDERTLTVTFADGGTWQVLRAEILRGSA